MNKYLTLFIFLLFISACIEQKLITEVVPPAVRSAFAARYPSVTNAQWSKEKEHGKLDYEAEWKSDGKEFEASFDSKGNFIEASQEKGK